MNINQTIKKSFPRAAMMLLATILLSMTAQPAWAETVNGVKYIDANGVEQTRNGVIVLTGLETTLGETGGTESSPTETWYLCNSTTLNYTSTLYSNNYCNVNIILADGVEMIVESTSSPAISFSGSLGIYGQSTGTNMGKFTAKNTYKFGNAVSSSGSITISHCKLIAECSYNGISSGNSGDIIISGAEVTATGDYAIYSAGGVSITGGKVTANGTSYGIYASGTDEIITISGAEVTATGQYAISAGNGSVSITDGRTVTATSTGSSSGYGIYVNKDVTISRSEVTAEGNVAINVSSGSVSITGGKVTANGTSRGISASGTGTDKNITIEYAEVTATGDAAIYSSVGDVSITGGKITANGTSFGIGSNGYDNGDVTIIGSEVTATANGTSGKAISTYGGNITIKEGAEVTAEGNLAIYTPGGGISISGGKVTANGIECGIGASGSNKNITIEKAEVTATANGTSGSAIITPGGGISITGGKVTANGIEFGIEANNDITISNAEVTATATGTSGSAIITPGGGVSIIGSKVTANGTSYGINSNNGVDLKWTNTTDFIMASSYMVNGSAVVKFADGQRFVAFTVDNTNPESPVENGSAIIAGTVSDLATIAGMMLRPLDGYLVSLPSGLSIDGKTRDFAIGSTSYYNIAENASVTVKTDSQQGFEFTGTNVPATAFNADYTQATFAMPAGVDVAITGVRYCDTKVPYIDADGNQATTPAGTKVYVLDGSETTLGETGGTESSPTETWYLCNTNLNYTSTLYSYNNCNVNIILADGVVMSVDPSSSNAIYIQGSLGIYGQSTGTNRGALTAKGTSYGIYANNDVTICSAEVTATATETSGYAIAIYSEDGGISITGGKVTAKGKSYGIFVDASGKYITIKDAEVTAEGNYAICATGGGVCITGGKVTANGTSRGIEAVNDITISSAEVTATAKNAIYSSGGDVNITGGKVTATGTSNGITAINNVTINNSEVTATGTSNGIHADNDVTISSSEVTAEGNSAISIPTTGGGVSITGGKVTANGTEYGIEAGGSEKYITITGAEVTAEGNYAIYAADVNITGGKVTANGTVYGVSGAITINSGTVSITGASAISDVSKYVANGGNVTLTSTSGTAYKVTFDDEWSDIPEVSLYSGSTVAEPTTPVRKGYIFGGWKNGSTLYDFNMPVTGNLTLVSVWEMKTLTHTDITIADIADQICTGSEIKPAVSIKDGETDLTENVDYEVAYSNNINVGTATVTITGKDGYAGTVTKTFVIKRQMKDLFADGQVWTGYVAEEDLDLPAGLTAYVITALGEESATATALNYIPQGVPVLLSRAEKNVNLYLASAGSGTAPTTNLLKVASTTVQPVAYQDYALYKDAFILYGGGTLASGKVFLALPQSSKSRSATRSIVIDGDDTTGMSEALSVESEESGDWYDLQGRRLEGRPLKRGLYIHNGQKTVIK